MGILVGCEKISHEWPGKKVFSEQTIGINEGERIGIVGKNGDGKSTLLQLISHELMPDEGVVTWRGGVRVGYLSQTDTLANTATVHQAVVGDMPEYEWASNPTIREIVSALLSDIAWEALVQELSGGQRRRVDLARVLIGSWDVLLMDEPTNHLDMGAISWLAAHLKCRWQEHQGALLVVTHDRWFLDEVCLTMWEVHDGVIDPFEGGYSAYIQQRVERERQAAVREERRQNMLRKELSWLAHGAQARTSKPKFRIDAAMELIANDPPLRNSLELKRLAVARLGKMVIEMKDAGFSYPEAEKPVVSHIDWLIGPGDRYGILGENGAGKTTLLKLMTGLTQPTHGSVRIGKSVRFGFLTQNLDALADKQTWRVSEVLRQYKSNYYIEGKAYSPERLLERLGFDTRELMSRICDISGGQARRLAIMCVLLDEPNVLVLDEPGNDLDTDMLAILEDLLDSWPGTLLVVTHDRYLMERVTDNQFALIDGQLRHVPGGVDEYLKLLAMSEQVSASQGKTLGGHNQNSQACSNAAAINQQDSGIKKLSNAELRELRKRHSSVERKLATASEKLSQCAQAMHQVDPTDFSKLQELQQKLEQAQTRVEALEMEWLTLEEALEEQNHA